MRKAVVGTTFASLIGAGALFLPARADFGYGEKCEGDPAEASATPTDPMAGRYTPIAGGVAVAADGTGLGVKVGEECSPGSVGVLSVSESGVYGEDYTEGNQIAGVVQELPDGVTPPDGDCPATGNDCDATLQP